MTDTVEEVKPSRWQASGQIIRSLITTHMTTTQQVSSRKLTQSDLKLVNDIIYKSADDICVSIARSFERMEERIEAMESRLYSRFADIEDLLKIANKLEQGH